MAWIDRRIPAAASLELRQKRIFILPTQQGMAFIAALFLMLLAAINYQNSLAYGLTFLLGSVFLLTILHTYRNLAGLRLTAHGSATAFVDEPVRFQIRLDGQRPHQAIAIGWQPNDMLYTDVEVGESADIDLFLTPGQRGWLKPGRVRVESRFPLGLMVAWSWLDLDQRALIYPKPLAGDLPLSVGSEADKHEGARSQGAGVDDFLGLKPYQAGDSRRRLDWKAYSRGQGLLVRNFATLTGSDLWLDFTLLDGDVEMRLSRLCHWVLACSANQQSFGLRLPNITLPPAAGEAHREAALRALALYGAAR
ncbi:uncharacterized protein (DUF58 family) [Pseudomonas duriflava]|uniref:Uncharacterized protein (DUF58 family) n=1 Tax=Pseudomonas duriflava TaxID=459528 RepID=A0A562Q9P1_9PSED|nr:DUF58 domain-containing protein [Pseudomonas duriflava]TWI53448.1 uncharacterized protein (DUF58 family) [Pseudomonas duriflava]